MKYIIAIGALAASALPAFAEVSEDLKFCGSLKSGAERLACYDAAARIATKPMQTRPTARAAPLDAQAAVPLKATALDPLPARNPFGGYYAAIGGGYGLATGRDFANVSGTVTQAFFNPTSTQGPNASIVAGRNIAIGWGVIGGEISGRWSGEKFQDRQQAGSFCCSVVNMPGLSTYTYRNDAGIHASIRAGVALDDTFVFAKAGVGATRVSETFTIDERGVQRCLAFDFFGNCTSFGPPSSSFSHLHAVSWLPSVLFGLGVEKNWGAFFARLSADFEAFNHKSTSVFGAGISGGSGVDHITWTTRGTALIGVRF
jgi:hypothetical protein